MRGKVRGAKREVRREARGVARRHEARRREARRGATRGGAPPLFWQRSWRSHQSRPRACPVDRTPSAQTRLRLIAIRKMGRTPARPPQPLPAAPLRRERTPSPHQRLADELHREAGINAAVVEQGPRGDVTASPTWQRPPNRRKLENLPTGNNKYGCGCAAEIGEKGSEDRSQATPAQRNRSRNRP